MPLADSTPHDAVSLLQGIRECVAMRPIQRQMLSFVAFSIFGAIAVLGAPRSGQAQAAKPNIVFILMDNLGYGELGVYGGGITRGAPTPRIDHLAAEGMRLTNFNVEAQCTPSRSAIMTGRFSIRSGTHSVPIGGGLEGLTQWEVTVAEALSSVGYATGSFGKWHLGSEQGRLPNDQGFDEWYGIPRTTDEAFWPSEPAAKAAGVSFEQIMEGHKGERSRTLGVYDLEHAD
jgi:arylsulfatase A-like enzyme